MLVGRVSAIADFRPCLIAMSCANGDMDKDRLAKAAAGAVQHMPEWVRHDLASKEPLVRERAEETLAAIIIAALQV